MPPVTPQEPRKHSPFFYIGIVLLMVIFLALAVYGGAYYHSEIIKTPGQSPEASQEENAFSVQLNDSGFCISATSTNLLSGPLAFICHGTSQNPLQDFSWSASSSIQQRVGFDIHKQDGTLVTGCCSADPLLSLRGKTVVGTLAAAPDYSYLGLDSYLDALKIGLAQNGYVMDPFTIKAPKQGLVLTPSWGEGIYWNQSWHFIKVQDDSLYVITATYVRPHDRMNLSMSIFIADPVKLNELPVVPR